MTTERLLVVGAGAWGCALALHAAADGQAVTLWGHRADHMADLQRQRCNARCFPEVIFPDNLIVSADLPQAVTSATQIVIAVPSHAFEFCLKQLSDCLSQPVVLLSATKGLIGAQQRLQHQAVAEIFGAQQPFAILSGPSFAAELVAKQPTAVVLSSTDSTAAQQLQQRLHHGALRIYLNADVVGVQVGGAVKNVLAIAVGIADGLGFGSNPRAALITRGLAEMRRLATKLGSQLDTLSGLSGVGDLLLTCTDNASRNRRFGVAVGQGQAIKAAQQAIGQVVEGVSTTTQVHQLALRLGVEMPITAAVEAIIAGQLTPHDAVAALLERQATTE